MYPIAAGHRLCACDNFLNAAFQDARVSGNSSREGEVLNALALDDRQHIIDPRATEKNIDANLNRSLGRGDLAVTIKRHHFKVRGDTSFFDGLVQGL